MSKIDFLSNISKIDEVRILDVFFYKKTVFGYFSFIEYLSLSSCISSYILAMSYYPIFYSMKKLQPACLNVYKS